MSASILAGLSLGAPLVFNAAGCLPGDTRPVPERVEVTAEPEASLHAGITTQDGWTIKLDRALMALGNVGFSSDDDPCVSYAETHYDRLYDFAVSGREKVGTIYGLGTCSVDFRVRAPSFDSVLGPGATPADVLFMRLRATDRYASDRPISVLLIGSAEKGAIKKRFTWPFRRSYRISDCAASSDAGSGDGGSGDSSELLTTVTLTVAGSSSLRVEVRPSELFRALPDDSAPLVFQPIADADTDGDGDVTFDELEKAPAPAIGLGGIGPDGGLVDAGGLSADGGAPDAGGEPPSMESLIYGVLLQRIVRIAGGGPCNGREGGSR